MAITIDDFSKIWASTSPLTPYSFSDSNYQEGWNFVGATPPSRQMWDFLQKQNDEKLKYLLDNFNDYLPLAGGTMTGAIKGNPITLTADDGNGNTKNFVANTDGTLTWDGSDVITRQMFLTRTVSGSAVTVNGNASVSDVIVDLTFAGYTPLGVVGFWFAGSSVTYFNIVRVEFVDGNKVSFAGRNFNANAITITPYAQALYIKN